MSTPYYFDKKIVTWDEIVDMVDRLSEYLFPPGRENKYDTIIGMQRGGVIVGTLLCSTISGYLSEPPELSFIPAIRTKNGIDDSNLELYDYLRPCVTGKNVILISMICSRKATALSTAFSAGNSAALSCCWTRRRNSQRRISAG